MTIQWKKPANGAPVDPDRPAKDQLIGALIVVTVADYVSDFETMYGEQPMAEFDLLVVDGEFAGYTEEDRREFGNLARQIGSALGKGETGLGRIESGTGAKGRPWFGIKWAEEPEDFTQAEAAMKPTVKRTAAAKRTEKAPF